MVQAFRSKDIDLSDTKIIINVLVVWLVQDARESHWLSAIFVNAWVQAGEINITDIFALLCFGVQRSGAGLATKKRVSRFKGWNQFKHFQEGLQLRIGLFLSGKVAPPHFNDGVTSVSKKSSFLQCGFVDFEHRSVWMTESLHIALLRVTFSAAVINASVVLVDRIGSCMIAIHIVRLSRVMTLASPSSEFRTC